MELQDRRDLRFSLVQEYSLKGKFPLPKGHLATTGGIFGCHFGWVGVLLGSGRQRPGILQEVLQCAGWPPAASSSSDCQ